MVIVAMAEAMWERHAMLLIETVRLRLTESSGREPSDEEVLAVLEDRRILREHAGGHYEVWRDGAKAEVARLLAVLRLAACPVSQAAAETEARVSVSWELAGGSGHLLVIGEPGLAAPHPENAGDNMDRTASEEGVDDEGNR